MKKCTKCEIEKPLSEFNKKSAAKEERRSQCKECQSEAYARWYSENKERSAETSARWYTENKERKAATTARWRAANKERKAELEARWKAENKERVVEANARWYVENKERRAELDRRRRARKACAVPQRWVKRDDVDESVCYWCGSEDVEELEHLHPISLGGPAVASNEHMACFGCNRSKHDKHPLVWIAELVMEAV